MTDVLTWSDVATLYPSGEPIVAFDQHVAPRGRHVQLRLREHLPLGGAVHEPGGLFALWAEDERCLERTRHWKWLLRTLPIRSCPLMHDLVCVCSVWCGDRWRTYQDYERQLKVRAQFLRIERSDRAALIVHREMMRLFGEAVALTARSLAAIAVTPTGARVRVTRRGRRDYTSAGDERQTWPLLRDSIRSGARLVRPG